MSSFKFGGNIFTNFHRFPFLTGSAPNYSSRGHENGIDNPEMSVRSNLHNGPFFYPIVSTDIETEVPFVCDALSFLIQKPPFRRSLSQLDFMHT